MSAPRWQEPNLAGSPFVNERPVRRLAVALWVLFAIAGAAGLWVSQTIRRETGTRLAELTRLTAETVAARERATTLETELRLANLPAQNVRTEFLNRRIAERSFSWNRLLETLTRELPRGVRLLRLSPSGFSRERGRARGNAPGADTTRVALKITGEAEETEALLEFVDRLFQHPAFAHPNLARESGKNDFKIQFDLSVDYLPQYAEELVPGMALASAGSATARTAGAVLAGGGGRSAAPGVPDAAAETPPASGQVPVGAAKSAVRDARAAAGRSPSQRGGIVEDGSSDAAAFPEENGEAPTEETGRPDPRAGRRTTMDRSGSFPGSAGAGGGTRPGAAGTPSAQPGTGGQFPFNVLPTPLKPYASGGGR